MGLAVTSHSPGVLSTATFDQLSLGTATMTPPGTVTTTTPAAPAGITSYPVQTAYNDGSQPTSLTYSDGEVLSYGYDGGSGWLSSLTTTPAGGSATTLLGSIGYSGAGGAAGHATSARVASGVYSYSASYDSDLRLSSLSIAHSGTTLLGGIGYSSAGGAAGHATSASVAGGTYNYSASYDSDLRLSSLSLANASSGTMLFASQRGYDAVGNVTAVGTTLAAGTDNQVFCYDDQHRLT